MDIRHKPELQRIRQFTHFPSELRLKPEDVQDLSLTNLVTRSLTLLYGLTGTISYLVRCEPEGALRVSTHGSGYTEYDVITDATPANFSAADELSVSAPNRINRFDLLVEGAAVEIRFSHWQTGTWGDAIPLPIGIHSMEFAARGVQIRLRSGGAGVYTITGWR